MPPAPFETLDKPARTARCEALARALWPRFGDHLGPLSLLNDGFNTTFRADSDRGPVVLRVHRIDHRTIDGLNAEHRWTRRLAADGMLVPELLETRDGEAFALNEGGDPTEPRFVSVFAWRPGHVLSASFGEGGKSEEREVLPHFEALGHLVARLHDHSATFRELDHLAPRLDRVFPFEPEVLTEHDLPPTLWALFSRARELCFLTFGAMADTPQQLCHADLHAGNLLVTPDGRLALLDFDDCAMTWPAYDLGIAAFYLRVVPLGPDRPPPTFDEFMHRLTAFERGYRTLRPFPVEQPTLATFMIARQLALLNLLAQERDPERRASFPAYCTRVEERLRAWLDEGLWSH